MAGRFRIDVLDMGHERYGDCLVVQVGGRTLLIDGGHPQDIDDRGFGFPSIPAQLATLFGKKAKRPYPIDLLVVTHCHADHIGCLPELVRRGIIAPAWALVADPLYRWGSANQDSSDGFGELSERIRDLLDAAAEEGPETQAGVEADSRLPPPPPIRKPYLGMLAALEGGETRLVRYGTDPVTELLETFADIGLKLLGPTKKHLLLCAAQIQANQSHDAAALASRLSADSDLTDASLLRQLRRQRLDADVSTRFTDGAALNSQSIVLSLTLGNRKALFTGDMQFVEPGVRDLGEAMASLLVRIEEDAVAQPYDVVKIAHHASHNAFNAGLHRRFAAPLLLISGGQIDPDHPDPTVLEDLRSLSGVTWYRTDRNGRIHIDLGHSPVSVASTRGMANDPKPNPPADATPPLDEPGEEAAPEATPLSPAPPRGRPQSEVALRRSTRAGDVEITARFPYGGRVVITIDMEGDEAEALTKAEPRPFEPARRGELRRPGAGVAEPGGDRAPTLLFVTDKRALSENTDPATVDTILRHLQAQGHAVLALAARGQRPEKVAERLHAAWEGMDPHPKAIVFLGGYDVVPSFRLKVLKAGEEGLLSADPDDLFTIWSDDPYAAWTDEDLPDVPLSRVPDARSSELLKTVVFGLGQPPAAGGERTVILNSRRPFARGISQLIPGSRELWISGPATSDTLPNPSSALAASAFYFMLHGSYQDATLFEGELPDQGGPFLRAFGAHQVPACSSSLAFAGCCWGALTVRERAFEMLSRPNQPRPLAVDESIALRFLASGAGAFVGCTGAHFSPLKPPYTYRSGPLHQVFWQHLNRGHLPAEALWLAKQVYHARKPFAHPATEPREPSDSPKERKIRSQFQCLGIGW